MIDFLEFLSCLVRSIDSDRGGFVAIGGSKNTVYGVTGKHELALRIKKIFETIKSSSHELILINEVFKMFHNNIPDSILAELGVEDQHDKFHQADESEKPPTDDFKSLSVAETISGRQREAIATPVVRPRQPVVTSDGSACVCRNSGQRRNRAQSERSTNVTIIGANNIQIGNNEVMMVGLGAISQGGGMMNGYAPKVRTEYDEQGGTFKVVWSIRGILNRTALKTEAFKVKKPSDETAYYQCHSIFINQHSSVKCCLVIDDVVGSVNSQFDCSFSFGLINISGETFSSKYNGLEKGCEYGVEIPSHNFSTGESEIQLIIDAKKWKSWNSSSFDFK